MSDTTTDGIRIEVTPTYIPERSRPRAGYHFFAYQVRITNVGDSTAKLESRHWVITDGRGRVEEVRGPGVVGKFPRLEPGEAFDYMSFCPLPTPVGSMEGSYQFVRDDGEAFDAAIAPFTLAAPNSLN